MLWLFDCARPSSLTALRARQRQGPGLASLFRAYKPPTCRVSPRPRALAVPRPLSTRHAGSAYSSFSRGRRPGRWPGDQLPGRWPGDQLCATRPSCCRQGRRTWGGGGRCRRGEAATEPRASARSRQSAAAAAALTWRTCRSRVTVATGHERATAPLPASEIEPHPPHDRPTARPHLSQAQEAIHRGVWFALSPTHASRRRSEAGALPSGKGCSFERACASFACAARAAEARRNEQRRRAVVGSRRVTDGADRQLSGGNRTRTRRSTDLVLLLEQAAGQQGSTQPEVSNE
jgi:hypothetical protein